MEIWDVFNEYREKTGKKQIRGEEMPDGLFHQVVHVWIVNDEGKLLIQQRQPWKKGWPNMWDCAAAGSVLFGETPEMAAIRETKEELGVDLDIRAAEVLFTVRFSRGFDDHFLIRQNVTEWNLQYEEVSDARWASVEEIREMVRTGEFIPYHILDDVMEAIASGIILQKAKPTDAEHLYHLQKQVFQPLYNKYQDHETTPVNQTFTRFMERMEQGTFYKIIVNHKLAGSVHVYKKGSGVMRLHMINILEEYQGRGLAQMVMKRIESLYPEATVWELDTILQEEKNCYLYEKMGYRQTGVLKKISDAMTLVSYEKREGFARMQAL